MRVGDIIGGAVGDEARIARMLQNFEDNSRE